MTLKATDNNKSSKNFILSSYIDSMDIDIKLDFDILLHSENYISNNILLIEWKAIIIIEKPTNKTFQVSKAYKHDKDAKDSNTDYLISILYQVYRCFQDEFRESPKLIKALPHFEDIPNLDKHISKLYNKLKNMRLEETIY